MIGSQDLLVGLAIVLFFFGAKRLPEVARSLRTSMKEFKKGVAGDAEASEASDSPKTVAPAAANAPPASRSCESCKTPMEPDWSHCPRFGALVPTTPPTSLPSLP